MKITTPWLMMLALMACTTNTNKSAETSTVNFDWLLGHWERTNESDGKRTYETWQKISSEEYRGTSYTLQNTDTVWMENVRLRPTDGTWNYEVTQKGEPNTTSFKLITIDRQSFVCENKANEFPKQITYTLTDNNLYAEISGGDTKIPFEFRKVEY